MSRSFFVDSLLDLSTNTSVKTKERSSQLASCEKGTKDALQRLLNVTVGNDIALRNCDKHPIDYRQLFSATLNRNSLEVSHFDNSKFSINKLVLLLNTTIN
jgi:hypothetical protein